MLGRLTFSRAHIGAGVRLMSASTIRYNKTVENNLSTETNRLAKTLTKFWDKVDTAEIDGKLEVQLDGKPLRTPAGFNLALPSQKHILATLVANEWANLPDLKVKTNALPLTSVVARAVDLETISGPRKNLSEATIASYDEIRAKIGDVDDIRTNILRYLDTDTCLIFAPADEYEGKLRQRQLELYIPLREEFESFFSAWAAKNGLAGAPITLEFLDCEEHDIRGNKQNIATQAIVLNWVQSLNMYELVSLERAILTSKLFLCGAALLRLNCLDEARMKEIFQVNKSCPEEYYFAEIEDIVELGNLETIFQTGEWGEVEDTHDVDKVDWLRNLTSAALLSH